MNERKNLSETIRIDLIPGTAEPQQEGTAKKPTKPSAKPPVSPLTRGNWPKRGAEPVKLPTGEERKFLGDGDELVMHAWCERNGARSIGFGECRAVIEGA